MQSDQFYLSRCLQLARRAQWRTSPNPMVGCVIVKSGRIIGEGYHEAAGMPHAEIMALRAAGAEAKGADLYVNLEPCSHWGRTPPCVESIVAAGIKTVTACTVDPNPAVSGKGFRFLEEHGIDVLVGIMSEAATRLNEFFFKWVSTGLPFVTAKFAMTLDGKIASRSGDSKWISNELSRRFAHMLRHQHDAVLVGISTVIKDNPSLTCRYVNCGRNPLRVVIDTDLEVPLNAQILNDGLSNNTLIVAGKGVSEQRIKAVESKGAKVCQLPVSSGRIDIVALLKYLGSINVISLLVEGGSEVLGSFFDAGQVDKVYALIAPKILGGTSALSAVGGIGRDTVSESVMLDVDGVKRIGDDVLISAYVKKDL